MLVKLTDDGRIYKQFEAAFSHASGYAVLHNGEPVAKVAFKFAKSGLQTTAYVHWIGLRMVRGSARGGGYDKASAACSVAVRQMPHNEFMPGHMPPYDAFRAALLEDDGQHWDGRLHRAGFTVFQVV